MPMSKLLCSVLLLSACATAPPPASPVVVVVPRAEPVAVEAAPTWLPARDRNELIPTVELVQRDEWTGWTEVNPPLTELWRSPAGRGGFEVYPCTTDDGENRVGIDSQLIGGKVSSRSADFVVLPSRAKLGTSAGGLLSPPEPSCWATFAYFRDGTFQVVDPITRATTFVIDHAWPAGKPTSMKSIDRGRHWRVQWPDAAFEVDVAARTVTGVDVAPPPTNAFALALKDYTNCIVVGKVGARDEVKCTDAQNSFVTLLWDAKARTVQPTTGGYREESFEKLDRPWPVLFDRLKRLFDPAGGRYLRLASGPIRVDAETAKEDIAIGFSDDERELRRYSVVDGTYEVIRRYPPGACKGSLGRGTAEIAPARLRQITERFMVVACVERHGRPHALIHGRVLWTEVLDLANRRAFRTPRWVRAVLPDGTVVVADAKIADSWSYFKQLWVATL